MLKMILIRGESLQRLQKNSTKPQADRDFTRQGDAVTCLDREHEAVQNAVGVASVA